MTNDKMANDTQGKKNEKQMMNDKMANDTQDKKNK